MIKEEGIVEKVLNRNALISIQESASCTHCDSRGACHLIGDKKTLIEVENDLHAKVGDRVEISMPSKSLLKLSFFVYFLPILAFVVGAYLCGLWAESLQMQPTLPSILGGGIALAITFFILRKLDRSVEHKAEYQPRMTRIIFTADFPVMGNRL